MTTYAVTYVLGGATSILCVEADDRDDAYDKARAELVRRKWFGASIQGTARPASQSDREASS